MNIECARNLEFSLDFAKVCEDNNKSERKNIKYIPFFEGKGKNFQHNQSQNDADNQSA